MATPSDVRRIALSFPGAEKVRDRFAFGVRTKGKLKEFAWVWMERIDPKKPRVPNPAVIAVRIASMEEKARLLAEHPAMLFNEPHYDGYPGVLVRLEKTRVADLRSLLKHAWRCRAPVDLVHRA